MGLFFILSCGSGGRRTLVRPFKKMSEKEKIAFLFPNDAERKGFAKQILTPATRFGYFEATPHELICTKAQIKLPPLTINYGWARVKD